MGAVETFRFLLFNSTPRNRGPCENLIDKRLNKHRKVKKIHKSEEILSKNDLLSLPYRCGPRVTSLCSLQQGSLQDAAAAYLKALGAGDASFVSLSSGANYTENDNPLDIKAGVLSQPISVDWSRSIYDTVQCATATEINAASNKHPYVIVTRMLIADDKITSIDSVVSDDGDWAFNATSHLKYAKQEQWDPIPEGKRDSRDGLRRRGMPTLTTGVISPSRFPMVHPARGSKAVGIRGDSKPTANTCAMPAFPVPLKVGNRRYTIDEELGAVDILNGFPWLEASKNSTFQTPSTNFFRIEDGQIRYIHEITTCVTRNCGR